MDVTDFPRTRQLDVDLIVLAEVASTNTYLQQHPGHPDRVAVVVSDNQTSGRGRQGRVWSLPPGSGLALSVRVPAGRDTAWVVAFPLLVGGVVCDVIGKETGVVASLKWPNDILVGGKKVSGILCETDNGALIAGVGVNITYPEGALPTTNSTSLHLHADIDNTVADRLVHGIVTGVMDAVEKARAGTCQSFLITSPANLPPLANWSPSTSPTGHAGKEPPPALAMTGHFSWCGQMAQPAWWWPVTYGM